MTADLETLWSQLVRRIGSPAAPNDASLLQQLDEMQYDLQEALFGGRPIAEESYPVAPDDRRLAYPMDQGLILNVAGRSLEAARAYLEAASRFEAEAAAKSGVTGDEADWAQTALAIAAKTLITGGQAASAAALLPRLDEEDRAEIEPLVAAAVVA